MNNLPEAAGLLRIARETLLEELKPLVGDNGRYTLAMIANAMAIAARELEAGEGPAHAELARLEKLYETPARELHGEALRGVLAELNRQLSADIRCGHFDAPDERRRALLQHLHENVMARLRVSNPKGLP